MKNTTISITIIVLLSAYSFLHNDSVSVASPLRADNSDTSSAPVLLAELSNPASDNINKAQQSKTAHEKNKPLEPAIRDAVRELVNTSHHGLVEEKTDKGVEIKLKGRFRTAPVATIDENGEVSVRDYTQPPVE